MALLVWLAASVLLAAMPGTSNYKLNSYGFGSGGGTGSTSNYRSEGISGEIGGQTTATSNYKVKPGFIQTQQANVPKCSLTNPSSYYDKLKLVIDNQSNPSDALFAISISSDNFVSDIRYVKADHTVGSSLTLSDYQTFSSWGSGSGFNVIGLAANTTYTAKVKATQGRYTESAYGPTSGCQVATVGQQLTFSISPNSEALGTLTPGSVISSPSNVTASIDTNADAGANIYISGANGGLKSGLGSLIASATADLSSVSGGFGVQEVSASSPLVGVSPYSTTTGDNVGITDTTVRNIFTTPSPISSGSGIFVIKAKASNTTPAAQDYTETLTVIAAAIF